MDTIATGATGRRGSLRRSVYGMETALLAAVRRRRRRVEEPATASRILVLRPDGIGDVVMTSALLRELRRGLPTQWITLAVQPLTYELVELCPHVDEVLMGPGSAGHAGFAAAQRKAIAFGRRELARRGFDTVILPR